MNVREFSRRHFLWLVGGGGAGLLGYGALRQFRLMPARVGICDIDPGRLAPLKDCMECCGPSSPTDAWNHSCIHPRAVAYSCGRLAFPGGPNLHEHDPGEVTLSRRLASEAGAVCRGLEVNASEATSQLVPFFITANRQTPVPDRLTSEVVRTAFGETIYPQAEIIVEPLAVGNRGWQAIADSEDGEVHLPPGTVHRYTREQLEVLRKNTQTRWEEQVRRWRTVMDWFQTQELHGGSFVLIGEDRLSQSNFGCAFPRLVLGITKAGSLVGVCGHAVQT
jgi:hypothetical protein